jgi:hypothetical protein
MLKNQTQSIHFKKLNSKLTHVNKPDKQYSIKNNRNKKMYFGQADFTINRDEETKIHKQTSEK